MYKKLLLLAMLTTITTAAFSQTTSRVEKALNDPKRMENSAKADVYIQSKPVTSDNVQTAPVTSTQTTIRKKRTDNRKSHS